MTSPFFFIVANSSVQQQTEVLMQTEAEGDVLEYGGKIGEMVWDEIKRINACRKSKLHWYHFKFKTNIFQAEELQKDRIKKFACLREIQY